MRIRATVLTAAVTGAAVLVAVVVAFAPFVRFGYHSLEAHVAIETAAVLIALLTGFLVLGRYRVSGARSELLLAGSLALFAGGNLFFAALPTFARLDAGDPFSVWSRQATTLLAVSLFAASAFAGTAPLRRPSAALAALAGAVIAALVVIASVAYALSPYLPAVDPAVVDPGAADPQVVSFPLAAAQAISTLLFVAAAAGFARRAAAGGAGLILWLGPAAGLAAGARACYLLHPTLFTDWVHVGDVLRLGFYLVMLVGAAQEIRSYWRGVAAAAVLEERRRLARDLHDGAAQELAFLAARARGSDVPHELAAAAERALDESRRAIAALTRPVDEPLSVAIAQAAEEIAARAGGRVRLQLAEEADVAAVTREAFVRIAREAVANALRHGRVDVVDVTLDAGDGIRLTIVDAGVGFDPRRRRAGLGLDSMRERAEAAGAAFVLRSQPGGGTEIEVALP